MTAILTHVTMVAYAWTVSTGFAASAPQGLPDRIVELILMNASPPRVPMVQLVWTRSMVTAASVHLAEEGPDVKSL